MFDILTALYYNELDDLRPKYTFTEPCTTAERQVLNQLKALDCETAETLKPHICALVQEQSNEVFRSGVRFGAQLMAQLLDEF